MAIQAGASRHANLALYYVLIAIRDSNGYPKGVNTTPDTVVVNTVYSPYVIRGAIDLTPPVKVNPVVTIFGGQQVISKTTVAANDYGTPTFTLAERDETLDALESASSVDTTTNSFQVIRGVNAAQRTWYQMMVRFIIQTTNSVSGLPEWDNWDFLSCELKKTADAGAGQITGDVKNPNPLTYALQQSLALRDLSGELLSGLSIAVQDNKDACIYRRTANPMFFSTYIKDGSATTFTLPYLPVSSVVTINASPNHMTINGTITAAASVDTATAAVGIAAGTTGDIVVMNYESLGLTV